MVTPGQTKERWPGLVSRPLRTAGFPTRGSCCAPQQAAQVEVHGLFLSSGAAPVHRPRPLHHLTTEHHGGAKGLEGGGRTSMVRTLHPILCLPLG